MIKNTFLSACPSNVLVFCRCRHNTHSLSDTGGFDLIVRAKQVDSFRNKKKEGNMWIVGWYFWYAHQVMQLHGRSISACHRVVCYCFNPPPVFCRPSPVKLGKWRRFLLPDMSSPNQQVAPSCIRPSLRKVSMRKSPFFSRLLNEDSLHNLGRILRAIPKHNNSNSILLRYVRWLSSNSLFVNRTTQSFNSRFDAPLLSHWYSNVGPRS